MARAVSAQELPAASDASTARVGIDSVTSADVYAASDEHEGSAVIDVSAAWRVASRVQVSFRPVISRGLDGAWKTNVYQAAMRYDRPGRVRLRFEGGYLPSPIGILPLESRADQNPMVTSAQNYDAWLPFFERGTPWVQLTSGLYPLAAQVTAAGERWDLRGAVLGSSTARTRPLTGEDKPPAAPQLAVGGGVTPFIGLRLGASFERGVYARASELAVPSTGDRHATIVGLDADYSVGFTRVYADWIQGVFDRATGSTTGRALTVTGVRTLSPRWYVAARLQHAVHHRCAGAAVPERLTPRSSVDGTPDAAERRDRCRTAPVPRSSPFAPATTAIASSAKPTSNRTPPARSSGRSAGTDYGLRYVRRLTAGQLPPPALCYPCTSTLHFALPLILPSATA